MSEITLGDFQDFVGCLKRFIGVCAPEPSEKPPQITPNSKNALRAIDFTEEFYYYGATSWVPCSLQNRSQDMGTVKVTPFFVSFFIASLSGHQPDASGKNDDIILIVVAAGSRI